MPPPFSRAGKAARVHVIGLHSNGLAERDPMRLAVTAVAEHPGPCTVRLAAVRNPPRGGETVVRLLVERDGRRVLRSLDERCPERTVDAGNEADIRGVMVLVGNTV